MRIHPFVLYAYIHFLNGTEDGYWKWTSKDKNFKFKWIDDEIPEKLKMTRFDLMGNIGIKFSPEDK
jgi:hypothetical protein